MPGCVLRASGADFDVEAFLANSTFSPCAVFQRGEPRTLRSARINSTSGFNLEVSTADGGHVPIQI